MVPGTALYHRERRDIYVIIAFIHNDTSAPHLIQKLLNNNGVNKTQTNAAIWQSIKEITAKIRSYRKIAKARNTRNEARKKREAADKAAAKKKKKEDKEKGIDPHKEAMAGMSASARASYKALVIDYIAELEAAAATRQKGVASGQYRRFCEPKPNPYGYEEAGASEIDEGAQPYTQVRNFLYLYSFYY